VINRPSRRAHDKLEKLRAVIVMQNRLGQLQTDKSLIMRPQLWQTTGLRRCQPLKVWLIQSQTLKWARSNPPLIRFHYKRISDSLTSRDLADERTG
jgi:hypothetical protein